MNRKKGELFKMISKVDEDVLFKRFEAAENVLISSMFPKPCIWSVRNTSIKMHSILFYNIDPFEHVIIIMTGNSWRIDPPQPAGVENRCSALRSFSHQTKSSGRCPPSAISYCQYFLSLT